MEFMTDFDDWEARKVSVIRLERVLDFPGLSSEGWALRALTNNGLGLVV
jgi:hypothetical protein